MQQEISKLTFIGFGEASQAFVQGLKKETNISFATFDIKSLTEDTAQNHKSTCEAAGVTCCENISEAMEDSGAIFSLVTADQALSAAKSAEKFGLENRLFLDGNSCAPQTKQQSEKIINGAGGRYVDVAIMSPIHPKLHKSPILISGPHAKAGLELADQFGMSATHAEGPVGTASAIKLCRSIAVKGLEALCAEMSVASRTLGVEETVINSLEKSYPGFNWKDRSSYALDRMIVHGKRRSAEMDEAVQMIRLLGLPSNISEAASIWQKTIGDFEEEPGKDNLLERSDLLLTRFGKN